MARLKNIVSAKVKGNTGAVAFRKRTDAIIVAERSYTNSAKADNATATQRIHRLRWTNVVEFYNSIKPILKRAWEGPVSQLTSWNHFTKANLSTSPVFLTKQEAALHAAVIAPYIVSRGRLTPVRGEYGQDRFLTNIKLGQSADLSTMSVADFAAAIIANNDGWQYGDKLSICRLQQLKVTKSGMIIPKIAASYLEISLDPTDSSPISSVDGWSSFAPIVGTYGDLIITLAGDAAFGIHSRLSNGMLYVSAQDVVLRDPASCVFLKYTGEAQLAAAMDSYGYRQDEPLVVSHEKDKPVFYDYVESDGIAYFNSRLLGYMSYTYEFSFQQTVRERGRLWGGRYVNNSSGTQMICNILTTNEHYAIMLNGNQGGGQYTDTGVRMNTNRHTVRIVLGEIFFDDESKGVSPYYVEDFIMEMPLSINNWLVHNAGTSTGSPAKARWFYYKVWDKEGNPVLDLRPCTFRDVPGMWDTVSGTFFGNAIDQGAFTVGNLE